MDSSRRIVISIISVMLVIIGGTSGYMILEGWNALDALYMAVITLSTVGYGEVHSVSQAGRIFSIILIVAGVGLLGYTAGTVIQFMVEGRIRILLGRRKLNKQIDRLKNHYIICGYGRIGRIICKNLKMKPEALVVIEKSEDLITTMDADDVFYVCEDAIEESALIKAGIGRAKGLVAALATDADNVFLILTARQLNPDLFIVARAGSQSSEAKLKSAGADAVKSPYEMGALAMAQRILRPTVTSFVDLATSYDSSDIQMEEIPVSAASRLAHVMLKDSGIRQDYHLIIIAIKKADGNMQFNPSFETVLQPGDTVIAVGEENNLKLAEKVLDPETR